MNYLKRIQVAIALLGAVIVGMMATAVCNAWLHQFPGASFPCSGSVGLRHYMVRHGLPVLYGALMGLWMFRLLSRR